MLHTVYLFRNQLEIEVEQFGQEVEDFVLEKTKNVLYDIFIMQCGNVQGKNRPRRNVLMDAGAPVTSEKIKACSQPEPSADDPTGAACASKRRRKCQQVVGQRSRGHSVGVV